MSPFFQMPDSPSPDEEPKADISFATVPRIIRWISFLLRRRYFIMAYGDSIPRDGGPYLILANHPAFIDPLIVYSAFAHLRPRPLIDEAVAKRFGCLVKYFDPIIVPDLSQGGDPASLEHVVKQAAESLMQGHSVLMWPSGRLQRDGCDILKGRSGAWRIIKAVETHESFVPELILVRTEGLWGSRFSHYLNTGKEIDVIRIFFKLLPAFLLFGPFLPHRQVRLMLRRHTLNRTDCANVERLNAVISAWFMAGNRNAVLVPVVPGITPLPMPIGREEKVPLDVDITAALQLLAPYGDISSMNAKTRLIEDLGIDSLAMVQLILKIENICGYAPAPAELRTVADMSLVLLNKAAPASLPILAEVEPAPIRLPPLAPVHELFSRRGGVTDITLREHFSRSALMAYAKAVSLMARELPERNLGIALPAGAAAMAAFAGCLGAGKVPVMLNYTMGSLYLEHCAATAGIRHVLTSRRMYGRGIPPRTKAVYLEDVDTTRLRRKALASVFGFDWFGEPEAVAVILFTSGSEALPKGVPLTHHNLMSNLRALLSLCMAEPLSMKRMSLLCCLPPFHSLGFLTNLLLPLVCGVPAVCIADPGNAPALAKAAVAYGTTHFVGTPGFLHGMLRAAQTFLPFMHVMVGAEICSQEVKNLFASTCPEGTLIEGYGVTECSPVISLNYAQIPGSVGHVLPGFEYKIHEEQLHVRGESVFSGYLDGHDPKVSLPASTHTDWYPTGDFFREEHGALFFQRRSGRFVKRGTEAVSLSAMEAALSKTATRGQQLALVDGPDESIIAFGQNGIKLAKLNAELRAAGFGIAWRIDKTYECSLPRSATGKIDYQALKGMLESGG